MAGRSIWKGYISFKTLEVPVKLHTAVREERVQFQLLHKSDHMKLRQQMVYAYENKPVPKEEQTKGFKLEEGRYILVDPEELKQFEPEESREITVHEFVKSTQIDPIFFERTYYLEPDTPSREYSALAEALKEMEVQGLCTWTMRKRSYFGSLQQSGSVLRLNTLRYADEIVPVQSLGLPQVTLSEKELKVGGDLINQLTGPFEPEKYENEHQKKLQDLIDKKARGEKIAIFRPKRLKATAPDTLLKTLEESLKRVA